MLCSLIRCFDGRITGEKSAINLARHPTNLKKIKHLEVRFHLI